MSAPLQPSQQDQAWHRDHDADRKEQGHPVAFATVART